MKQQILSLLENLPPAALWAILILSIALTGFWRVYKLHPEWRSKKFQIASEISDRLRVAYENYRAPTANPEEGEGARIFRFEAALRDYCKAPVHHRVGDMALRAECPTQALDDIKKLRRGLTYKDGVFQQRLKPYRFPSENAYRKWQRAALVLYVIASVAIGVPIIAASMGYWSAQNAVLASVSLGYLPVMVFAECIRSRNRAERLYRMSVVIKKNGGRLYGEDES